MIGTVHWFPLAIVLFAIALVGWLWFRGRRADKRYVLEDRKVRCRAHDNQLVRVTLVRDATTGKAIGVRSCSAANPPDNIRCTRDCLRFFETSDENKENVAAGSAHP